MSAPATELPRGAAIRVFLAFAAGYFMSYALRSVNAMIAPALIDEFGLSNAQLGSLSAAYFLSFAALQLPLGIWLDRYGSRRVDATLLLIAAAGCTVFAMATGTIALWIGRALIGAGVAGALMCALRAFRFWYASERQQQLAAWMLVAGTFGALATTVPVQLALPVLGWRGLFWVGALLLIAASAA
ncbi:MAG TPA: MFS transporter, partial [Burkholderiaceae bacterium]|nr:MFS transporter [Burkholderiaceae bacterium]